MSDIVEIMARAIDEEDWFDELSTAQAVLAALEEAGYQVVKKTPGIRHEQAPYLHQEG